MTKKTEPEMVDAEVVEEIATAAPRTRRSRAKGPEKVIKYLINQTGRGSGDELCIEVPETWKLTFSSVNPASQGGRMDGYCIRVYEMPGSKLRAVFDNVSSFRDVSIPLVRKVKSEMGSATWNRDSVGNFKEEREVKVAFELLEENDDFD